MEGCIEITNFTDPTSTHFVKNGIVVAKRTTTIEGDCKTERWYRGDKLHRPGDLPAVICYKNDQKTAERWYIEDQLHRDGGRPAAVYYENGQIVGKWLYKNGTLVASTPTAIGTIEAELAKIKRRASKNEAAVTAIIAALAK
jgi:antitoxin component YwqK of YwqJK toxin-antitoxin module